MTRDGLVTIYDGTGQNDDVKIKWRKRIRAYGRSMILSFLVSNFLSYSGNLNRGRKKRYAKVWYSHYCSTSCYKNVLFRLDALHVYQLLII